MPLALIIPCVYVFFPFILVIKFVRRTRRGHTGFLVHLSAARAFIFLARRIQPFLSLVDSEVEFCVLTTYSFSTRWAFLFSFFSFSVRKIPFAGIELTSQRVRGYMVPLSYRGRFTRKYCRLQKRYKMRLNVCFNEMALFGPFEALIKVCSSYGRNGDQPTRRDGCPARNESVSPLRDLDFLKISCIFLLCVECNRRHSYLLRICRLFGVCYSGGRHRGRHCA